MERQKDLEKRRSYKAFGDRSDITAEQRDIEVKKYQEELQNQVFLNGGQLRDYQAEGVTWLLSNYVNKRSSILADEMGYVLLAGAFTLYLVYRHSHLFIRFTRCWYISDWGKRSRPRRLLTLWLRECIAVDHFSSSPLSPPFRIGTGSLRAGRN